MAVSTENKIWDIRDNLILRTDGTVNAIFEVPRQIVNKVDLEGKETLKDLTFQALDNIKDYKSFEINIIPMDLGIVEKYEKLKRSFSEDTEKLAYYILNGSYYNLKYEIGEIYEYKYFITVPLKSMVISPDIKTVVSESYSTLRREALNFVGFNEEVPENWYEKYRDRASSLENQLSLLNIRALKTRETFFINRLSFLRGTEFNRDQEILAVENNIDDIDDSNIDFENITQLVIHNRDSKSYVAFMPIALLPDNVSHLNLIDDLQALPFPVEVITKARFVHQSSSPLSILSKARRLRRKVKNTQEDAEEAGSVQKGSVAKSKYLLEDIEEKIDEKASIISYLQFLVLTDTDLEMLLQKKNMIKDFMQNRKVKISNGTADQYYLFYKSRITEAINTTDKNFLQTMSLKAFCENLFFSSRSVGNDVGWYIGRVDNDTKSYHGDFRTAILSSNNLVFTDLLQANKLDVKNKNTSNPHVAVIGETGAGKSFLTKLLFVYHSLLNTKVLYIDPKAEMKRQFLKVKELYEEQNVYPEIVDYINQINFITLDASNKSNWGALDPIVFLNGSEAKDLAISMVNEVYNLSGKDEVHLALLQSIDNNLNKRLIGEKVGMLSVFKDLVNNSDNKVRQAGKLLIEMSRDSMLSLVFSDGANKAVDTNDRISVLEIKGLKLPKKKADNTMTMEESRSLTVMYALGHYCAKFGKEDPTQETIGVFDEAWFFNSTPVGQAILMEMKRVGRSQNNFLIYVTQSVRDLDSDEDGTGFGTVFAFLEDTEVEEVLEYLRLPKTKETIEWVSNMTMGQCIYSDILGNKERITVDGMFPEINKLFDTVETKSSKDVA